MNQFKKCCIFCMSFAAMALCTLPLMRTELDGGACELVIQGYNLMEFSAWGCVPMIAVLLVPVIVFGCQSKAAKELELILLCIANMVSYVHSFNTAKAWLYTLDCAPISYHPGMFLYPLGYIAVLLCVVIFEKRSVCEVEYAYYG